MLRNYGKKTWMGHKVHKVLDILTDMKFQYIFAPAWQLRISL